MSFRTWPKLPALSSLAARERESQIEKEKSMSSVFRKQVLNAFVFIEYQNMINLPLIKYIENNLVMC